MGCCPDARLGVECPCPARRRKDCFQGEECRLVHLGLLERAQLELPQPELQAQQELAHLVMPQPEPQARLVPVRLAMQGLGPKVPLVH